MKRRIFLAKIVRIPRKDIVNGKYIWFRFIRVKEIFEGKSSGSYQESVSAGKVQEKPFSLIFCFKNPSSPSTISR